MIVNIYWWLVYTKKDCEELIKFYENNIDKTYTGNIGKSVNSQGFVNSKSKNVVKLQLIKKIIFLFGKLY